MVSEAEFDKNQASFREKQQMTQGVDEYGNPVQVQTPTQMQNQQNFDVNPFSGSSIEISTPIGNMPYLGTAGGPGLGSGVNVAGLQDDAARAVYAALTKAGLTKEAATSGASQAAIIMRTYIKGGKNPEDTATAIKAIEQATKMGAIRGGIAPPAAAKLATETAKAFKPGPLPMPTVAETSTRLSQYSDMLKSMVKNPVAQFALGMASGRILGDFLSGTLGLSETKAQQAIDFYINGEISKEEYNNQIQGLSYNQEIKDAWKNRGEGELVQVQVYGEIGRENGITPLVKERPSEYSDRVQTFIKSEENKARTDQQAMQEQTAKDTAAQNAPGNAQGMTVAQVQRVNQNFDKGRVDAEIEKQKQQSMQKNPPTVAELTQLPPGQLAPSDMEKVIEAKTPNTEPTPPEPPPKDPYLLTGQTAPASLLYRTKAQYEASVKQSVTEEEWQRYLKTGRGR